MMKKVNYLLLLLSLTAIAMPSALVIPAKAGTKGT